MAGALEVPKFEVVDVTPWEELEGMLREIPLLGQPDTRPYADATISLERFRLSELASTTRYIQEDLLAAQGLLRASLLPQGFDQLALQEDASRLVLEGEGLTVRLGPPVVERYEPNGPDKYILDGAHRAQLARLTGHEAGEEDPEITAIFVRDGIAYGPYATPNPWEEVGVVRERPADKSTWKNYVDFDNRYRLYRYYDDVFDSQPRGLDDSS